MAEITIRDLIIHYTAKADAFQSAAYYVRNPKKKQELFELAEKYSDRAFQLSEIRRYIGKSTTTEMNILDNYKAQEKVYKKNFKEKYGVEVEE